MKKISQRNKQKTHMTDLLPDTHASMIKKYRPSPITHHPSLMKHKGMKPLLLLLHIVIASHVFSQKAELKGIITDASNNAPIPFANILVVGTQTGTSSDENGNFDILDLEPGFVQLQVSFIGYKTKISADVFVSKSNIPYIKIALEPVEEVLKEIVIIADPFEKKLEAPISMQNIGVKEIESNPGSNRDISRVIQSFPGVGSTPAYRNDVIIRGGGPSENRFFLDDVEIPVINHFSTQGASGGPVGIINADFIESVDFYSGSFPANKYNALSGIFDFKQKEGSRDKTNLQAALGASEAAFTIDGHWGNKTNYIFSVRRSYLQFLFAALELPFLPTFNDYQLKLKTNFDKKNQLTVISLGSLDHLDLNTDIKNPNSSQEYILAQIPINNQWSYTFGAVYKRFFDKGFSTFVLSRNMLNNVFYKYPDNNENMNKIQDYESSETENKFRYELTFRNKGIKYNVGVHAEYAKYYNATEQELFLNNQLQYIDYESSLDMFKFGFFGQATKRFLGKRFLVSAGFRLDGNDYNARTSNPFNQFSPRISFSFLLNNKITLNTGSGRYFQQAAYTTLGYRNRNGDLVNYSNTKYIGANHYNLGLEYKFSKSAIFSVEGFYKKYFNYPIDLNTGASLANQGADYSVSGAVPVAFKGKGKAAGFEILNRINHRTFTLLASYTFVESRFSDINDKMVASSWDSKHIFTLTGSKSLKNNWRVGFKWRYVGGLPYTPYDLNTSALVQAWNSVGRPLLDYSRLNTERFDAFHQLDIRIDKNIFFNRWTLMLYLDIQNVYNFKNKGRDYIIRGKNSDNSFILLNNNTEYKLQAIANKSGTILPTVGIMVKF